MPPAERRPRRARARVLPALPIRDTVLFPNVLMPLFLDRDNLLRAVDQALGKERNIVVVAQRDPEQSLPALDDLYTLGTEAIVARVIKMPEGGTSVLVQGHRRVQVVGIVPEEPYLALRVIPLAEKQPDEAETQPLMRAVLGLYEKVARLNRNVPDDHYVAALNIDHAGWLADFVASDLDLQVAERQDILETIDPVERLQKVSLYLAKEFEVLELQQRIHSQVQEEVDKSQREYFLREQIRAIQHELGESDAQTREVTQFREKIDAGGMPAEVRVKADEELERLGATPWLSPEVGIIRSYLEWLTALPWTQRTEDHLDIHDAADVLEANHYGLTRVKERILEFMAVRKLAADRMRSPVLCFVGPPGVGKTSLGRSIAEALGRHFVRVSLGGIHDEAEIRGHRRTYIGAMPGRIIQTMRQAGTVNPVFMLDEIDKVGVDFRGDPSAALLEALDPEQSHAFSDHYLDVHYNLSEVMFITTANVLDPVPSALRDRLEVIELPGYIEPEKMEIARRFLVPRQVGENGLSAGRLKFTDESLHRIIRDYTYEAGVRNLEREIGAVCRKVAKQIVGGQRKQASVTQRTLPTYLGAPKFHHTLAEERDEVGVATGVCWTPVGGEVMTVEVSLLEGSGNLVLTGQLGEVMRESAQAALSYARSRGKSLGLPARFYEKLDVHVHVPEGAIPKDGPSAGITMATALISALTRRAGRREVALTGEITLRGRILPVGGIREKVLAAHRAGLKTFVMPRRNLKELEDVPIDVKRELRFVPTDNMDDVLPIALHGRAARLRAV